MGAAASCLGLQDLEVTHAYFSRGSKHSVAVRDFSRKERNLNVHVEFSTTSSVEKVVVSWRAIKVKGGAYKAGQYLYVDDFSLQKSATVTSTYTLSDTRKAWPAGSYKVEVRMINTLKQTSTDKLGRKKLSGNVSKKKMSLKRKSSMDDDEGRLVLTLPYTID